MSFDDKTNWTAVAKDDNGYLVHHGIKGQKWGVIRTPEQLGHETGNSNNSSAKPRSAQADSEDSSYPSRSKMSGRKQKKEKDKARKVIQDNPELDDAAKQYKDAAVARNNLMKKHLADYNKKNNSHYDMDDPETDYEGLSYSMSKSYPDVKSAYSKYDSARSKALSASNKAAKSSGTDAATL